MALAHTRGEMFAASFHLDGPHVQRPDRHYVEQGETRARPRASSLLLCLAGAHYRQLGAQLVISQQPAFRNVAVAAADITMNNMERPSGRARSSSGGASC